MGIRNGPVQSVGLVAGQAGILPGGAAVSGGLPLIGQFAGTSRFHGEFNDTARHNGYILRLSSNDNGGCSVPFFQIFNLFSLSEHQLNSSFFGNFFGFLGFSLGLNDFFLNRTFLCRFFNGFRFSLCLGFRFGWDNRGNQGRDIDRLIFFGIIFDILKIILGFFACGFCGHRFLGGFFNRGHCGHRFLGGLFNRGLCRHRLLGGLFNRGFRGHRFLSGFFTRGFRGHRSLGGFFARGFRGHRSLGGFFARGFRGHRSLGGFFARGLCGHRLFSGFFARRLCGHRFLSGFDFRLRLFSGSEAHRIQLCAAAGNPLFMLFVIVSRSLIFAQVGQTSILDIERFFLTLDIGADADDIAAGKFAFTGDPISCIHNSLAVHGAVGFLQLLVFKDFAGGQIRQTSLESFRLFLNFFHFRNGFRFDDRRYILCGLCSCFLRNSIAFRLALFRDDGLLCRFGSLSGDRLSALRRSRLFLFLDNRSGFFLLLNDGSRFFLFLDDRSRFFLLLRSGFFLLLNDRSRFFLLLDDRSRFFLLFGSGCRSRLFLHFRGRSRLFDGDFFHCCRFFDDGLFPFSKHADRNGSKQHRHGKQQA